MRPVKKALADEMHKPARRNYNRRHVTLKGIGDLWQADLVDMKAYSRENKGNKYLLTVIDCLTKYAWAKPVKSKSAQAITRAFELVLKDAKKSSAHPPPLNLHTDRGTEFYNGTFTALRDKYDIHLYSTYSVKKASIVERFNRTLKTKMWHQFSFYGNHKWIGMLPRLMREYNNSVHRTIGMAPAEVEKSDEKYLLTRIRHKEKKFKTSRRKLKVGDYVRLSKNKHVFEKGYTPNWSLEIYKITQVQNTSPTTYILEDEEGKPIKGGYYLEELQKTRHKDIFLIDKVLQKRGRKYRVSWLGFDAKHNSWVDKNDFY